MDRQFPGQSKIRKCEGQQCFGIERCRNGQAISDYEYGVSEHYTDGGRQRRLDKALCEEQEKK